MRHYKSGTRWGFWLWTVTDSEYIKRLHIIKTPYFAICLHWLLKGDPEPWLHDHPVTFLSLILRGGYAEIRTNNVFRAKPEWRYRAWYNWIRADGTDIHRITYVEPRTLTLCFMGPKTREWGFHTRGGWVYWKDFYAEQRAANAQKAK